MKQLMATLRGLTANRQILVLVAGVVLGLLLIYLGIQQPLEQELRRLQRINQGLVDDSEWLRQQVDLHAGPRLAPAKGQSGSLIARVNQGLGSSGLAPAVKRVQPSGDNQLRVELENADFRRLIEQLAQFEKESIFVEQLQLNPGVKPGTASGRLGLELRF